MAEKPNVTIAFMGHVDSGKSTILGNMLYQLGKVSNEEISVLEKESL